MKNSLRDNLELARGAQYIRAADERMRIAGGAAFNHMRFFQGKVENDTGTLGGGELPNANTVMGIRITDLARDDAGNVYKRNKENDDWELLGGGATYL